MIKKENIKELLNLMYYTTNDDNVYVRTFENSASVMVDLRDENIITISA